jgi:tetratricopeptide (TPR) repeat protein
MIIKNYITMKKLSRITFLFALLVLAAVNITMAQRVLKGIVYIDGKPASGITVEAHKGSSMMTSFDGKYEVTADPKSKYIKFTLLATGESKKWDLVEGSIDEIDFAFTGTLPGADAGVAVAVAKGDIVLKSAEELLKEQDKDFMNQFSLYSEFYKQGDYASALPHWQVLFDKYPKSTANIYIHGAKIFEYLIENAKTDEERDKYLDAFMKGFDQRIEYFGGKGYVLGRKATAWLEYKLSDKRTTPLEGESLKNALQTAYGWLSISIEEQKTETELPIYLLLMQTTRSLFKLSALPKEDVIRNYDKCNSMLNELASKTKDEAKLKDIKEIQTYIETLFSTSGAADCGALVSIYTPQFQAKNSDTEFIKSLLRRLRQAKCDNSELVEQATVRLYELEPSAEAAFNMARGYVKKENLELAKKYYDQAISQEKDPKLLASYYYERGYLLFAKQNAYAEAREMARKAIALDPDLCDAYMLIGNIYVEASRSFSGEGIQKSAIFWVAVDYFNKARKGDDCAADAATKAADLRKYFPNKEEAFMEGLNAGQSYKVGGWINETTTVRF